MVGNRTRSGIVYGSGFHPGVSSFPRRWSGAAAECATYRKLISAPSRGDAVPNPSGVRILFAQR
jgi:hypothetical protein